MARVFKKHGLRLEIDISYSKLGPYQKFPFISLASWVRILDKTGNLENLFGLGPACKQLQQAKPQFLDFWEKYKLSHGEHELWDLVAQNNLELGNCVPVYIHGDEGVTYKRGGALVLLVNCPIGSGTAAQRSGEADAQSGDLRMNFLGHCFKNRFVLAMMLKVGFACAK